MASHSSDRHRGDAEGRRDSRASPIEVVAHQIDSFQELVEVEGDRDFAHRIGELAVLDPETRGAAREVAGHRVEAEPHHFGDVKSPLGLRHDGFVGEIARLKNEVRSRYADTAARSSRGARCGWATELSAAVAVAEVGREYPALDHAGLSTEQPFAIERARSRCARQMGI